MTAFAIAVGIILIIGMFALIGLQLKKPVAESPARDQTKELVKLEKDLENERREKNELAGKGKQLYDNYKSLEAEYKAAQKERDSLKDRIAKFEARREQAEEKQRSAVEKLEKAEQAFKEERARIIREEEEARKFAEEERDRIWAEHENAVVAQLADLCKLPQFQFTCFSNKNLPEEFDGSLKPDFLIEFLGQYVIFDAKASKAQSLQKYIDDAVKMTAEKVRKNGKTIYPHVFLVVPTQAIPELKKVIYPKDELMFYVISREALAPILASLKRITKYDTVEQLDPQKRENIVSIIADLATHINLRNAHELLLTRMGTETLDRAAKLAPDIAEEAERKQSEKKLTQLSPSEIKRLVSSITEQHIAIAELASPKTAVKRKAIEEAGEVVQKLL